MRNSQHFATSKPDRTQHFDSISTSKPVRVRRVTIAVSIEQYLAEKSPQLRPASISAYQTALRKVLLPWAQSAEIEYLDELDAAHLAELSGWLAMRVGPQGKPLSAETRRSYLRQINYFLSWSEEAGLTDRLRAKMPRATSKQVRVLEPEQMRAMIAALPDERDRLIMQVLCETGVRVGELVRLDVHDVIAEPSYRRYWLHVHGDEAEDGRFGAKNHKDRRIGVSALLYRRLWQYIEKMRPEETTSTALFLNKWRSRETGLYDSVTTDSVQQIVKRAARRAGIDARKYPKLGPHLIRKSFASAALKERMDRDRLRIVLGHADDRMLREIYAQQRDDDTYEDLMRVVHAGQDRRR